MKTTKLIVNVIPNYDLKSHKENEFCLCLPRIKQLVDRTLIVHNAFDGREFDEIEGNNNELKDWIIIFEQKE